MILGAGILWLVWIAVTRSVTLTVLTVGFISSWAVILFWRAVMPPPPTSILQLAKRPFRFLRFALALGWRFCRSTLTTSWMILRGRGDGRIMALPIRIEDSLGRFMLLNSITLTPSTISLLVEEDLLYIHWLQPDAGTSDWRDIKDPLECHLQRLFEEIPHVPR